MRTPAGALSMRSVSSLSRPARLVAGILGVAHEIHENLQHLVLVDRDRRHLAEFALQRDPVAHEGAGVQAQAVLHQLGDGDGFGDAAQLGIALLHRHRVLDVFQIVAQRRELFERHFLVARQLLAERSQVFRYSLAAFVVSDEVPGRRGPSPAAVRQRATRRDPWTA